MQRVEDILNTEEGKKSVYKKYKYFPFHLIDEDECMLHFVLGIRGDGKTYNAKKQIFKDWYERGIKSYWVVPTKTEMEEMVATKDFHLDLLDDENKDIVEYVDRTKMEKEFLYDENNDWFMRVIPLSMYHKYKKGKHPLVHSMYFDEFMRETYLKNEAFKVQDLIVSVQREKKEFRMTFLGNAISLNHPMFVAMGLYQLAKDKIITVLADRNGEKPLAKIWDWRRPAENVEEKNGGLLWYELGEVTGYNDYAVRNEFKNDNLDNLVPNLDLEPFSNSKAYFFEIDGEILRFTYIPKQYTNVGNIWYVSMVKDKKKYRPLVEYALLKEEVRDGVVLREDYSEKWAFQVQKNAVFYDSVVSKQLLFPVIKKYV